jgi:hypothetical protein
MNKKDHYSRVIEFLRSNKPALSDKEELIDGVMQKIQETEKRTTIPEKLSHYLFGWTNVVWIRGAMAVAATLFIGIFIIQQVVITDRINSLEKQLVKTVNTIQNQEPDLGIMQKVFLNVVAKGQLTEDSITVSRSDLEELLDSYLELKKNYDEMKENRGVESYIQKKIRQNIEKGNRNDKSEL